MSSRRNFVQTTVLAIAGAVHIPYISKAVHFSPLFKTQDLFPVAIAGYTFAKYDVAKSIDIMKRLDVHRLSLKDMHLPINSSNEEIKKVTSQFADAGIQIYAVGVIYMKTKQAVDEAFDYARKVGVNMIVGVPNYDLLDYTEQKVKATNIKIAIHNHGPEDALYPGPADVYNRIKNRDKRVGLCMDIGHATRAGANLDEAIKAYKDRLFDLHIKDVTGAQKDAKAIEIGRGVIDFKSLILTLQKVKYAGTCSIEYEKDMTDIIPGLAESVGYFKGVMAAVR